MKIGNVQNININHTSNYSMQNRTNYLQPTFTAKQLHISAKKGLLSLIGMGFASLGTLILGRSKDKSNVVLSETEEKGQEMDWYKYSPSGFEVDAEIAAEREELKKLAEREFDWADYSPRI